MRISNYDTVGTAGAFLLAALGFLTGTGCQGFYDLQDLELARGEASFIPTEIGGTFAFAFSEAARFSEVALDAQVAQSMGAPLTEDGCLGINVLDAVATTQTDESGEVHYDLSRCPDESGGVLVAQHFELLPPEMPPGGGEGYPGDIPDVPPGTEANYTTDAIATADSSHHVVFDRYAFGMVGATGSLAMETSLDGGTLESNVLVSALDYRGRVTLAGDWAPVADGLAARLDVTGTFDSVADNTWTVVADKVVFEPGCMDGLGGELAAYYENSAGRVTVKAVFDDVCDGCSDLYVNDEFAGRSCFGDGATIGGAHQQGAE